MSDALRTPQPKKRLHDMTKEELRSECKKVGKKVGGLKGELYSRLKEPTITNNRGWNWQHGSQCDGGHFLAQGEHRLVHLAEYTKGPRKGQKCVWKVFKTGSVFESSAFDHDIQCVNKASELMRAFMASMLGQGVAFPRLYMNMPAVWQDVRSKQKCLVEPYIEGTYQKFNSNSGWSADAHPAMSALSHFSWHYSEGKFLVCDLQGSCDAGHYLLTDPVVLSTSQEFGSTDGGQKAIDNFFAHHRCGMYCQAHWGRPASAQVHFPVRTGTSFFFR